MRKLARPLVVFALFVVAVIGFTASPSTPVMPVVEAGDQCSTVRSLCWDWAVVVEATCELTGGSNCQQEGITAYGTCVSNNGCPINN